MIYKNANCETVSDDIKSGKDGVILIRRIPYHQQAQISIVLNVNKEKLEKNKEKSYLKHNAQTGTTELTKKGMSLFTSICHCLIQSFNKKNGKRIYKFAEKRGILWQLSFVILKLW